MDIYLFILYLKTKYKTIYIKKLIIKNMNDKKIHKIVNESIKNFINEDEKRQRFISDKLCYVYASFNGGRFFGFDFNNKEQVNKLIYCTMLYNDEQTQIDLQKIADKNTNVQLKFQLRRPQDGKVVFQTY